ncbi:MAG: hypothetical protein ACRCX8_20370 [Sarcina sp.]
MSMLELYSKFSDEKIKVSTDIIYNRSEAWTKEEFIDLAEKAEEFNFLSYIVEALEDVLYG